MRAGTRGRDSRKSGRLLLRLPKSAHEALAKRAKAEGISLNTMLLIYVGMAMGIQAGYDFHASAARGRELRRATEVLPLVPPVD